MHRSFQSAILSVVLAAIPLGAQVADNSPFHSPSHLDRKNTATYGAKIEPTLIPNWRVALGRVMANNGNARILAIGDSTTIGACSAQAANSCNATVGDIVPKSWPTQLARLFGGAGITASWQDFFGGQGSTGGSQTIANDFRVNTNGQWGCNTLVNSLGGCAIYQTTAMGSALLSFTSTQNVDTFKIYYAQNSGEGVLAANIDGGAEFDGTTGGSPSIGTMTVNGVSPGVHTLNMARKAGVSSSNNVFGIEGWDSTTSQIIIDNAGWSGAQSSHWASNGTAWNPANAAWYSTLKPDLVIITLGINDWDNNVSGGTYTSNIQTLVNAIRSGAPNADVLFVVPVPTNTSNASDFAQGHIISAVYNLARTNKCGLVDLHYRWWDSFSQAQGVGLYGDGFTHPSPSGYFDIAKAIFDAIF